jgi:hypothetical protein
MTMLDISVTIQGDKVVIDGLGQLAAGLPGAVRLGLERSAIGIERIAFAFLAGAGSKESNVAAGGYPVPVRTGDLRRHLDWLKPGESKSGPAGTITAGQNEVIVYNSELYANVIHEGIGSSAKFGPRKFLTDALERFNADDRIKANIEEEISSEIAKAGLK